jgi:hypothetical protein
MNRAARIAERRVSGSPPAATIVGWRPLTLSEAHALWQQKGGGTRNSARAVWLVPSSPPAARADHRFRSSKFLVRCCKTLMAALAWVSQRPLAS